MKSQAQRIRNLFSEVEQRQRDQAYSAIRTLMRERFEEIILNGRTADVLNDLTESLADSGWSRLELLQAMLWDLFPEDMAEPADHQQTLRGLVPRNQFGSVRTSHLIDFVKMMRGGDSAAVAKPRDRFKPSRN